MDHSATPSKLLRRLPILLILAAAAVGIVLLRDVITLEAFARHRESLLAYREAHYLLASLGFVLAYTLIVALSLPGATVATLTGGFLFGLFPGVLYNVTGAGLGAVLVFLAARAGFGADIAAKVARRGGAGGRLLAGLQANAWSALLTMRLVPVVPFFVANLLPAFANIGLLPFAITTFVGIIPAAFVFTSVGSGLGEVLAQGRAPDLAILFTPQILLPILGLAALSALPMILRALARKGG